MALITKLNFLKNLPYSKCIYCKPLNFFLKGGSMNRRYSIHGFQSKRAIKLAKKDNIPGNFKLVYQSSTTKVIHYGQLACYLLSASFGVILMYYERGIFSPENLDQREIAFGPESDLELWVGCILIAISCIAINIVCLKSPIRIYSDGKKFIGVRNGILGPFKSVKFEFNAGDGKLAAPSKFSLFNSIRYKIGKKEYYIFEHCFETNLDFNRMIGSK